MTLFGYDQGVFGGVVVTGDYLDTLNLRGNPKLLGTISAIYDIGCFFGAIMALVLGDWLGRKKTILLGQCKPIYSFEKLNLGSGTTIMSIGAILQITAYSVPHMIVGR